MNATWCQGFTSGTSKCAHASLHLLFVFAIVRILLQNGRSSRVFSSGISLITNVKCAVLLAQSIERVGTGQRLLESKSWNEYLQMTHFFDRS